MRAARELRSQREVGEVLRFAQVGIRVRRGPDWEWDDQDGGGPGTIVEGADEDGWVRVKWDVGGEDNYRVGAGGSYDLMLESSTPPSVQPGEVLRSPMVGVRVRRGPDWRWDEQDGGAGHLGTTTKRSHEGWVTVRWDLDSGNTYNYRVGGDGGYDLVVAEAGDAGDAGGARSSAAGSARASGETTREAREGAASGQVLRSAEVGVRVRAAPGWEWGDQGGGGLGTTAGATLPGWVRVSWDDGSTNSYQVGANNMYDLIVAEAHRASGTDQAPPAETTNHESAAEASTASTASTPPPAQPGEVLRSAEVGVRVRRGPDWEWGDQDGGGVGTTEEDPDPGWVRVRWDHSRRRGAYRVGLRGLHDLIVVERPGANSTSSSGPIQRSAAVQPGEVLRSAVVGVRVRRGPGWDWGDQDGGGLGTTTGEGGLGVLVTWDHGDRMNSYHIGPDRYDLIVAEAHGARGREGAAAAASSQTTAPAEPEGGHDEQWLDMEEATGMQCPICFCVPRDALAHECGNLFCEICWTRWIAQNSRCPVCREDGVSIAKAFRDQRKILNLMIRCPLGCEETFRLGDKEEHVSQCPKRKERCSLCGEEVLAEMMSAHHKDCCIADIQTSSHVLFLFFFGGRQHQ